MLIAVRRTRAAAVSDVALPYCTHCCPETVHFVRVFIDNKAAKKQCESGTDTGASAPYLRNKAYCESKIYARLMWLDFVPGSDNSADMGTKRGQDIRSLGITVRRAFNRRNHGPNDTAIVDERSG